MKKTAKTRTLKGNPLGAYFLRKGFKMLSGITKPQMDKRLDKVINKRSLARSNYRILNDDNLQDPDALRNEAFLMLLGIDLPHLESEETVTKMLNIRHSGYYAALWDAAKTLFSDIVTARRKRTLEGSPLADRANYVIARGLAQKYHHDDLIHRLGSEKKDRAANAAALRNTAVVLGLEHDRTTAYEYQDEETGQITVDVRDNSWQQDQDQLENIDLLQQAIKVMNSADRLAATLYYASFRNGTGVDVEFRKREAMCKEAGLNSPAAVRQRMSRLKDRPEIKQLRA